MLRFRCPPKDPSRPLGKIKVGTWSSFGNPIRHLHAIQYLLSPRRLDELPRYQRCLHVLALELHGTMEIDDAGLQTRDLAQRKLHVTQCLQQEDREPQEGRER